MNCLLSATLLLILLCSPSLLLAQGENNNWHFGRKYALDFNQNPPQLVESNIMTMEAGAAMSDAQGSLLFYTMGAKVWDRNGNLMPNGDDLLGNGPYPPMSNIPVGSNQNGVLIVRNPGNKNQYYVVCGDPYEVSIDPKVYYSMVDMTLNNGLGDVVDSIKNRVMMTNNSENMAVTWGADCKSFWVLVQEKLTSNFYAYKIDENGVSTTPVITPFPTTAFYQGSYTQMTFAPDGTTMAFSGLRLHLAKFNNATGVVYDFLPFSGIFYGGNLAFSPDASKLYIAADMYGLMQVDLSLLPNTTAVSASLTTIENGGNQNRCYEIRLGPDNKLYTMKWTGGLSYIGRIESPNIYGTGCNNVPVIFSHPAWSPDNFFVSLGEPVVVGKYADTIINSKDSSLCFQTALQLNGSVVGGSDYIWNTGENTEAITVNESGTYWVKRMKDCTTLLDTFHVQLTDFSLELGNDTLLCSGSMLSLNAYDENIENYLWSTGETTSAIDVSEEGSYHVTVEANGCSLGDTIKVYTANHHLEILQDDTTICKGTLLNIEAESNFDNTHYWNTGATGKNIQVDQSGTYIVSAQSPCGYYTDSVTINVIGCNCDQVFVPNAFSPNGDGKNDEFGPHIGCDQLAKYYFSVYNRYGQRVFHTIRHDEYWNGLHKGNTADAGVYFYYISLTGKDGKSYTYKGDLSLIR